MKTTSAFSKIVKLKKRLRVIQGGTSASKTYSILQILAFVAANTKKKRLISIVTDTMPNLKTGALRDFENIMKEADLWDDKAFNATDKIYTFPKAKIEFIALDKDAKARGGRRDILFVNECNRVAYPIIRELMRRTSEFAFFDYNPTVEFWLHDEGLLDEPDTDFIILTYKDNEFLSQNIVNEIERDKPVYDESGKLLRGNPNQWRIYGLGHLGVYEGLIFKEGQHWTRTEVVPAEARLLGYGLDFGYSKDPAALIAIYYCDHKYYLREIFYETELTNLYRDDMSEAEKQKTIQHKFETLGVSKEMQIVADHAEPKSIEDLRRLGYNVIACKKGADSIRNGINTMQSHMLVIEQGSENLLKELRMYTYKINKDGKATDQPIDDFNHALDAVRYFFLEKEDPEVKHQSFRSNLHDLFPKQSAWT